jgi:hypothetical protein
MRRPVKPFVTEYKGPNRRPGHPAGATQRQPSEEFSYASAANEVFGRPHAESTQRHNPEDSYEAALRAADALFSPSEKPAVVAMSAPRIDHSAMADQDQPGFDSEASELAAQGGGRILRAIDEPPMPGLAELEAEHAPKRRGRKPGSKNKAKAPVFQDDAPRLAAHARPAPSASPLEFDDEDFDDARPLPVVAAPRTVAKAPATTYRERDDERFSWVRTKLKPGEEWKRRLPKVCW